MKLGGMFGAMAAAVVMLAAAPAWAGLDFTEEVDVHTATDGITLNGTAAGSFSPLTLADGFESGSDRLTVSLSNPQATIQRVALDFTYLSASVYDYSFANGDGDYDLVIQLGSITLDQQGGSISLDQVSFRNRDTGDFSDTYGLNLTLDNLGNQVLFIDIPESNIAVSQRDPVDVVRLEFTILGAASQFGINAVANPEPGTIALFGLGLIGLAGAVRRRRRAGVTQS